MARRTYPGVADIDDRLQALQRWAESVEPVPDDSRPTDYERVLRAVVFLSSIYLCAFLYVRVF